ncbi:MAG: hypothetical protein WB752_13715 [Pseudolabrys sp.]
MTNKNTRKFTSSDDALILQQPVSGVGLNTLAKMIRTSREAIIRRAGELGVSLDISNDHDDAADTRVLRRSDKLVDPLLERLKQVHGDRPRQRRTPPGPVMLDGVPER